LQSAYHQPGISSAASDPAPDRCSLGNGTLDNSSSTGINRFFAALTHECPCHLLIEFQSLIASSNFQILLSSVIRRFSDTSVPCRFAIVALHVVRPFSIGIHWNSSGILKSGLHNMQYTQHKILIDRNITPESTGIPVLSFHCQGLTKVSVICYKVF
jgi:hypothetical protein